MSILLPQIELSWHKILHQEFEKRYFIDLLNFLKNDVEGQTIYPPQNKIFAAFNYTTFDNVKVVLLGQDPYHGAGQANGLSFSVESGTPLPPSLKNIYKEINRDLGIEMSANGDLSNWAHQGVLLLNAVLTVSSGRAGSHQKKGWETFTDTIIKILSDEKEDLIFILWGNFARSKKTLINASKHYILEAPHPSPFSAHKGFFGCSHFSKTNEILLKQGKKPINWKI